MESLSAMTVISSGNMLRTEVMGYKGNNFWSDQNHKCGHLDKDST